MSASLLGPDDPTPVTIERADGAAAFVLVCDHAGRQIPQALGDLGLEATERARHIAWDIGALGVAQILSRQLDAPLVWQAYSRLVVDCNRPLSDPGLMATLSEATTIPGNLDLTDAARNQRLDEIYLPYHAAVNELLERRAAAARPTIFVSVHSFTPVYHGAQRPWELGLLYGDDRRLRDALLPALTAAPVCLGDNEPYRIDDKDKTVPDHAFKRNLPNILFEIRQDLIDSAAGQQRWSELLAGSLRSAGATLADAPSDVATTRPW